MTTVAILFWAGVFLVFYTYLGYGILLWLLVKIREAVHPARRYAFPADPPEVTLLIAAYPEVTVLHDPRRGGKTAALNRALGIVRTPLVVFTDAVSEVGVEDEEYPRPEEYRYGRHASKSSVNTCFIWLSHERRPSTVPRILAGVRCSPSWKRTSAAMSRGVSSAGAFIT